MIVPGILEGGMGHFIGYTMVLNRFWHAGMGEDNNRFIRYVINERQMVTYGSFKAPGGGVIHYFNIFNIKLYDSFIPFDAQECGAGGSRIISSSM